MVGTDPWWRPWLCALPDGGTLSQASSQVQLIAFEVAARRLAIAVDLLHTVVWAVAITPLPAAPPFVEGVINLRGEVVPVIDLRRRFGLPAVPVTLEQRFVVVRRAGRLLALRVDRVDTVVATPSEAIELAESVVPGARHAAAVVRLPDGVLVIQDLAALLSSEEETGLERALAAGVRPPEPLA